MSAAHDRIAEIYRQTVSQGKGNDVARQEAIEEASQIVEREIAQGLIVLDQRSAIRAALMRADELDGNRADGIISAAARGDVPLTGMDLDIVVTLGGGRRKVWKYVQAKDLLAMRDVRFRNYSQARDAYLTFSTQVEQLLPTVIEYGTFGDAYDAGGFPPANLLTEVA